VAQHAPDPVFSPDPFAPDLAPPSAPLQLTVPAFQSPSYTGTAPTGTQLFYSSAQSQTTVAADNGTALTINSVTGLPQQYPYKLLLEWGTPNQEIVIVTAAPSGNGPYTFTGVLRGCDGGGPQITHAPGAQVNQGVSAADFSQIPPVLNVCAFGADATGTLDSTPAIQAAINAAVYMSGNIVFFPPGVYQITSALMINSNITLQGTSRFNTIIQQLNNNVNGLSWTGSNLQYVNIRDLTIQGTGTGGTGTGISLTPVSGPNPNAIGVHLENVRIRNWGGNGFAAQLLIVSQFDNVFVESCANGFSLTGTVNTAVVFNSCYAKGCTGRGYDLENLTYCTLNGCASDSNNTGYYILNPGGVTINSSGSEFCVYGFEVYGGVSCILNACFTFGNTGVSFWVTDTALGVLLVACYEQSPNGATNSFQFDTGCDVSIIGWTYTTAPLQTSTPNQLDDGQGNFQIRNESYLIGQVNAYGLLNCQGGTSTATTVGVSSPTFVSGTALEVCSYQDAMLYIAVQTAAALAVAIGPASSVTTSLMPSKTYALGLISFRVPMGWYVKITGTIADLTITQVTC
jgi:hypothetical protein